MNKLCNQAVTQPIDQPIKTAPCHKQINRMVGRQCWYLDE